MKLNKRYKTIVRGLTIGLVLGFGGLALMDGISSEVQKYEVVKMTEKTNNTDVPKVDTIKEDNITMPQNIEPPDDNSAEITNLISEQEVISYIISQEDINNVGILDTYYTAQDIFNKENYKRVVDGLREYLKSNSSLTNLPTQQDRVEHARSLAS